MKHLVTASLLLAGLINLYPLIGVVSAEQLTKLYGVSLHSDDLILLMRHRAVLFGMLGSLILVSVFKPALQDLACIGGLISMLAFLLLAFVADQYGDALNKAVVADIVASVGLLFVLFYNRRKQVRKLNDPT